MNYWMKIIEEKIIISEKITDVLNDRFSDSEEEYSEVTKLMRHDIDKLLGKVDKNYFNLAGNTTDYELIVLYSQERYHIRFSLY